MTDVPDNEHTPSGPGKRPTINDVAHLAGVSKKTVSRVINRVATVGEDVRERVDNAICALGFTPNLQARSLAFRRSFLVGLIYDNPSPTYVVNMQLGVLDALGPLGFELVVHPCSREAPSLLDDIRGFVERQRLAGAILPPPLSEDERIIALLRELGCRYVRVAALALDEPEAMVTTNDQLGAAEAARWLVDQGHRRIALVRGPSSFCSSEVRGQGFLSALAERGITLDPACDVAGAYTFESGVEMGHRLLGLADPPTAIFALNDDMAIGVMQAARERGLDLPAQLSIVGFDDLPMAARVWPNLTSVRLPIREMGNMAALKLLAPIVGDALEPLSLPDVRPALVLRQSAIALPGAEPPR
ncbi:LacI family DNA-binding transcriptional regulator [Sphingomonas parva]|uniref:LacI family DNA-binding transcriptional regulator n=1 Tax=Sphingomonas parva TaxID=2555898 RepID=A0A4Y8ZSB6_9SPHN|nr:LacI family DNA-binding transcriptional regulator [Sphingomonas parva]TFI58814.1 LacI family DNA-binding transcriptional regulator [Sphingomonas parva]